MGLAPPQPGAAQSPALGGWIRLTRAYLMDYANPHILWWVLGEVACPAIRDLIAITPGLAFLWSLQLQGRFPEPPYLMQDLQSYQRGLFAQGDVDFNACIETYLCLTPWSALVVP